MDKVEFEELYEFMKFNDESRKEYFRSILITTESGFEALLEVVGQNVLDKILGISLLSDEDFDKYVSSMESEDED